MLHRPPDAAAARRPSAKPVYNTQLRAPCVATRLDAGHADNALPQLARASLNCRILPDQAVDAVRQTLVRVLDDERIAVTSLEGAVRAPPSPLDERVMHPIERLVAGFWPGIPVIPVASAGATDGRCLRNAGVATFGHSGPAMDVFDVRAHGKDERVPVGSFFDGSEHLDRLVEALSSDAP